MKRNLEYLLKQSTTPAQYTNSEWNSEHFSVLNKKYRNNVIKVCLCYPDKYVVGMSNLGIEILYKLLNSFDDILCERVFAVEPDLEKLLLKENERLFSLESHTPLNEFDIIGFSLQSELCYTNIFTILHLAKIPFKSVQRKKLFPLIIAGGPCSCNPAVLSDYIDFFVLGEAEDSILSIIDIVKKYKFKLTTEKKVSEEQLKFLLLNEINNLDMTYVPMLNTDKPVYPQKVDINNSFYPRFPTVPNIRIIHQRLNIELTRGCGYNCNFCQAGYIYRPLRMREFSTVIDLVHDGILSTGYNEVTFSGFCVTNYPKLVELIKLTKEKFCNDMISISLPSLRIDDITEVLISELASFKKVAITVAPEAATERLRRVINKFVFDRTIYEKLLLLYKYGIRKIKLYFMIGIPTETISDVESIGLMIKTLKKLLPGMEFNVTVTPFVPKPHTPFQFAKMESYEELINKMSILKKYLKNNLRKTNLFSSLIEALISRGDKKIGNLIESVWNEGARFDAWDEYFNPDIWLRNIKKMGINLEEYVYTQTDETTRYPWDVVKYGYDKKYLYKKFVDSVEISKNDFSTNKVFYLNIEDTKHSFTKKVITLQNQILTQQKNSLVVLRLKFARYNTAKFLSHLDQIEIFRRTLRMSRLPLCYTSGFSPQIKMSFGPPISVGHESKSEFVDVELYENVPLDIVKKRVNEKLPVGFSLLEVKKFYCGLKDIPSLESSINLAEYYITSSEDIFDLQTLQKFLSLDKYVFEKHKKDKIDKIDLREIVKTIEILSPNKVRLMLRFAPNKTLKPEVVIREIFNISQENVWYLDITRENLYIETFRGKILEVM